MQSNNIVAFNAAKAPYQTHRVAYHVESNSFRFSIMHSLRIFASAPCHTADRISFRHVYQHAESESNEHSVLEEETTTSTSAPTTTTTTARPTASWPTEKATSKPPYKPTMKHCCVAAENQARAATSTRGRTTASA